MEQNCVCKPIYCVSRTIGEMSSYFNVIFRGRFLTGENTNVRMHGISVTFAVFVWRQVLRPERIMVYKLQRFLQYSTLYILWRNAYLYRSMNHTFTSGTFPRFALTLTPLFGITMALTHANFACEFTWQLEC